MLPVIIQTKNVVRMVLIIFSFLERFFLVDFNASSSCAFCEKLFKSKDEFSNELVDNYNAIYRSKDELIKVFNETLIK